MSSLGIRFSGVTVTLINSGNGQNCNCNPEVFPQDIGSAKADPDQFKTVFVLKDKFAHF